MLPHESHVSGFSTVENIMKDEHPNSTAGCCVNSCLVWGRWLSCSNLGDCRAVFIPLSLVNNSNSSFSKIRGFNFENNICNNSGIRTIEASIGSISKNTFENGIIRISQGCTDLSFIDNTITGGRCFQDDNTDAVNIIKQNNTCN